MEDDSGVLFVRGNEVMKRRAIFVCQHDHGYISDFCFLRPLINSNYSTQYFIKAILVRLGRIIYVFDILSYTSRGDFYDTKFASMYYQGH